MNARVHTAAEATATAFISLKDKKKKIDAARNAVEVCVLLATSTCKAERGKKQKG